MPLAAALRRLVPAPDHLEPERLLAAASGGIFLVELVATLLGVGGAIPALLVFGALAVLCGIAAHLRRLGRNRNASLIAGSAVLVAVPILALAYPERYGLVLLAPLGFVFAVPHLTGRALGAFAAVAATLTALAIAAHVVQYAGPDATIVSVVTSAYGGILVTALLFTLIWRAHRTARATDIRFRRLVEDLPVGVARCGADGRLVDANAAFARILGYADPDELTGVRASSLLEDVDGRRPARSDFDDCDIDEGEIRLRRRDGTEVWARYRTRVERDESGRPRWYDMVVDDVTADRADRETRNLLAAIVDQGPDAIFAQGLDGTILTWNAGGVAMYGWTPEEFVGRSVFELIAPEDRAAHEAVLERVRGGEIVGPMEAPRVTKDGREVTVSLVVGPARDEDGRVVAVATYARDISEQVRMRAEQAALEAQLRQASKMEAVGRLAGGVAHSFNNLLTTIQGYGTLVADGLSGRALEDQQLVLAAASHASELVRRLLQFSREAPVDPRPVEADAAVRSAVALVERLVPATVSLDVRLAADARVVVDPVDFEQALLSLVANALDAMPSGGTLSVSTATAERYGEERQVRIAVHDTGTGMDEATLGHAFEPFFTTKPLGEGVGLGLASVYAFAQRARGDVELETALGEGTTVTLTLPVARGLPTPAAEPEPRRWVPTGTERVLLVEDDPAVRDLAARILRRARYDVTAAESPQEALALLATTPFQVLVSDVVMPFMTGADLAGRQHPDLPIVFISGYPGEAMPALGLDLPTRTFVAKPFAAVDLVAAVRAVLDADPLAATANPSATPASIATPAPEPARPR